MSAYADFFAAENLQLLLWSECAQLFSNRPGANKLHHQPKHQHELHLYANAAQ